MFLAQVHTSRCLTIRAGWISVGARGLGGVTVRGWLSPHSRLASAQHVQNPGLAPSPLEACGAFPEPSERGRGGIRAVGVLGWDVCRRWCSAREEGAGPRHRGCGSWGCFPKAEPVVQDTATCRGDRGGWVGLDRPGALLAALMLPSLTVNPLFASFPRASSVVPGSSVVLDMKAA